VGNCGKALTAEFDSAVWPKPLSLTIELVMFYKNREQTFSRIFDKDSSLHSYSSRIGNIFIGMTQWGAD
jgi:hypothetical protein